MPISTQRLLQWIRVLPDEERLPFFKLTTGALRIGVSKLQVIQSLSAVSGVDAKRMAQRMMGYTQAGRTLQAEDFATLIAADDEAGQGAAGGHPYPFFLAHSFQAPLDEMPALLGPVENWLVEWKFDGIRAQYIHRAGHWWLWSRGEELVSESFPEMAALQSWIPDGEVLDGELLAVKPQAAEAQALDDDKLSDIQPFASLQQRLGRKVLAAKILLELPVAFIAYDILEHAATDVRASSAIGAQAPAGGGRTGREGSRRRDGQADPVASQPRVAPSGLGFVSGAARGSA